MPPEVSELQAGRQGSDLVFQHFNTSEMLKYKI